MVAFGQRRPALAPAAMAALMLESMIAVGATLVGSLLIIDPNGTKLELSPALLAGSPLDSFLLPGFIILVVFGGGALAAVWTTFRRHRAAPRVAMVLAGVLIGGLVLDILLMPLEPMAAFGWALAIGLGAAAVSWPAPPPRRTW